MSIQDSRADMLARMRSRLGRNAAQDAEAAERVAAALRAPVPAPRPPLPADLTACFIERALSMQSTVARISVMHEVPQACADYLARTCLPPTAVVWPQIAALDWAGAGIEVVARAAQGEDLTGITGSFCALAETGTLVLCSGPDSPATVSLLPETHIAIVDASRILAGMEEAFALLRREAGGVPRSLNFVSGPSRTGDIEQTIVLGAHGPSRVHLVVVG
ncbi:MAG: lactate utilization protein C [Rhodocyclaceae bacterium]|nr:lactate utilization protein C [Rhodocyclaceae bacterium]MBX3667592.1 lactate utilization protein C [Rhodocyclaceae bacterium]